MKQDSIKECPECCSKNFVVPILYGLPSPEMLNKINGKYVLGGCGVWEKQPEWYCKKCMQEILIK